MGSRNPKLSTGLRGTLPRSPSPHSRGNVFNGLGRVVLRVSPAAYWWVSRGGSNWCSGGEGREGQAQGDDGFVSPCLSHAWTPPPSCHHPPCTPPTHTRMLLSIKILKEVVHPNIKIQSLFTHPHVVVAAQNGTQRIISKLLFSWNHSFSI